MNQKLEIMGLSAFVIFLIVIAQTASGAFCPEGAYLGLDNQGEQACRYIDSNEIVNVENTIVSDSPKEVTESRAVFSNSNVEISIDSQTDYTIFWILGILGAVGSAIGLYGMKVFSGLSGIKLSGISFQSWDTTQKETVKARQYQMCNICYTKPAKWAFDHIDGNKKNNDILNCQGLCQKCKSEKSMISI